MSRLTRPSFPRVALGACALVLLAGSTAHAQVIPPTPPTPRSPVPAGLNCTAEALNVSGFVDSGGNVVIYNVPTSQGAARVHVTCVDAFGNTVTGQSAPVRPFPGGRASFAGFDFGTTIPIPAHLGVSPSAVALAGVGTTAQLTVTSTFADLTTGDLTVGGSGTTYRTSNPAVATVSADGQVKAIGTGTAIISALNDGAVGLTTVRVLSAPLLGITVTPSAVSLVRNPLYQTPIARLSVKGTLGDGTITDLAASASGTTYTSSNPQVAPVSADGMIAPIDAGVTSVHVVNAQGGSAVDVPVTVTSFSPAPFAAYNTPGFAHNVDLDGKLAFIADGPGGLQILDISGGTTVGKVSFGGFPAVDIKLRGKLAAVALADGGFTLVDVADPSKPTVLSHLAPAGSTNDLWISGDTLYVASSDGLFVYDIADATAPLLLGSQSFGAAPTAVSADSTRGIVTVVTAAPALVVLQASGPLPWASVTVPLPPAVNQADDVLLAGTSAYVADGTAGLIEVDVTNPAAPSIRSSSTLTFNALGVALRRSAQGTIVAAADNKFVNAVPFFDERLGNTFNVDFSSFPGDVQSDANSTGIALGDGFGVVTVGDVGIQVFLTQQLTDNAGVPPSVTLGKPQTGSTVPPGDLYFLSATAADDVAVASVDFLIDGVLVASDVSAPFSANVPAGAPCTTQLLEARATDVGGNLGESSPVMVKVLCSDGQACSANTDCASGACSGGACQACTALGTTPTSCAALKAACPSIASGTYALDPDGAGPDAPFQAYCEMSLAGGGWTMVAKLSNQDTKHWINAKSSWTSALAYGPSADLSVDQDAKSPAWGALPATEFMWTDNANKASGGYVQTTSACIGGLTLSQFFTNALATYPDTSGDNYYRECATFNTYVPNWTIEPGFYDQTADSPSNSLNQGYLSIGYANGGDTQAVISFYSHGLILAGPDYVVGTESEADCGLGTSEENGLAFGLGDPQQQDIGATQFFDEAFYKVQYPETVYMFAR